MKWIDVNAAVVAVVNLGRYLKQGELIASDTLFGLIFKARG